MLLAGAGVVSASYSHWQFGTAAGTKWTAMETDFTWQVADPEVFVFFSQQCWWGNSAGYFGTQHKGKGGGFNVIFSMWDNGNVKNTARWPEKYNDRCGRFGGEGQGSHCVYIIPNATVGTTYNLKISLRGNNGTGTTWGLDLLDKSTGVQTDCGELYFDEELAGVPLGNLSPTSAGFQEYFIGGNQPSSLAWVGPTGTDTTGKKHVPTSASCQAQASTTDYCAGCADGIGCGPDKPVFVLSHGPVKNSSTVTYVDHGKLWG